MGGKTTKKTTTIVETTGGDTYYTNGGTRSGTLIFNGPSTNPILYYCALFFWLLFLIIACILLIAAVALPNLVKGSAQGTSTTDKVELGLFRTCVDPQLTSKDCSSVNFSDYNNDYWVASAALFIAGLFFLVVVIVLVILGIWFETLLSWAKGFLLFTNLLLMIATLLVPLGFNELDSSCSSSDYACGMTCSSGSMGFFKLCAPFDIGAASIILFVGMVILFIASFIAACVPIRRRSYKLKSSDI